MLVDEIEYATIYGKFKNANESELYIYLSNVNFEATYTYYGSENFEFTHVRLYTANSIRSENPVVCRLHKEWIRSLMKASTLITQSGEVTRYKFLEEQRRIIKEM